MITIKRHPNLTNWLEIRFFSELVEQVVGHAQAVRIASHIAKEKKSQVVDLTCKKSEKEFYESLDI
jgi:ribosomal protein L32E